MSFASLSLSALVAVLAAAPAVNAHMTMFHPSMYGFNAGDACVQPLAGKSFGDWVCLSFTIVYNVHGDGDAWESHEDVMSGRRM